MSTATAPRPTAPAPTAPQARPRRRFPWTDVVTTVAAFVLAFLVGAVLMIVSDTEVRSTFAYFFARPGDALGASWDKVSGAYAALLRGAVGGYGPLTQSAAQAAPLICAGLGVGLAFRAGLFNIGAQGQAILGAIVAAYIGFAWHLPPGVHFVPAHPLAGTERSGPAAGFATLFDNRWCVLVPGLAFDRSGTRLGYGKGFYDRLLAEVPPGVPVVGVVPEGLIAGSLPRAPHDVPMTHLLSERGIYEVGWNK